MYLGGVLPSLEEACAEHWGGADSAGVGVLLGQDGQIQAVQAFQTTDCPPTPEKERNRGESLRPVPVVDVVLWQSRRTDRTEAHSPSSSPSDSAP